MATRKRLKPSSPVSTEPENIFLPANIDMRTKVARRFQSVFSSILADQGNMEIMSEGRRQLARRCAALAVIAEQMEAQYIMEEKFNLDDYLNIVRVLNTTFKNIGLDRRQIDLSQERYSDIHEYIEKEYVKP
jgi:hypothetical protein